VEHQRVVVGVAEEMAFFSRAAVADHTTIHGYLQRAYRLGAEIPGPAPVHGAADGAS